MTAEYTFDAIQLANGRWQVVNRTLNTNTGLPTSREKALQRAHEFNHPWRGRALAAERAVK